MLKIRRDGDLDLCAAAADEDGTGMIRSKTRRVMRI